MSTPFSLKLKSTILLRPQSAPDGAELVKTVKEGVDVKTAGGPYIYWQRQYRVRPEDGAGSADKPKLVIVEEYHKITEGMCFVLSENFAGVPARSVGDGVFVLVNEAGDSVTVGDGKVTSQKPHSYHQIIDGY